MLLYFTPKKVLQNLKKGKYVCFCRTCDFYVEEEAKKIPSSTRDYSENSQNRNPLRLRRPSKFCAWDVKFYFSDN